MLLATNYITHKLCNVHMHLFQILDIERAEVLEQNLLNQSVDEAMGPECYNSIYTVFSCFFESVVFFVSLYV